MLIAMNDPTSNFRWVWITAGQGTLWDCNSTYCEIPYKKLPQTGKATDDLRWLDNISPELHRLIDGTCRLNSADNQIANLENVVAKARGLGLVIPETFLRLMRSTELQD
jgi:hypothetical protein